ncbi:NUDIX domain-containing protein [Enterobacter hormaechei]|uniref:NUDIX domain-containing protein n=1 Tax=Enterobacter hormaechei TaxID=158836 RepID=UPI00396ACE61
MYCTVKALTLLLESYKQRNQGLTVKKEIKTLESRQIYRNRWMSLKEDRILRANGSEGLYSVIEKDDFVVIIPVENDEIYLVEQYRYPLGQRTTELPQGSWECSRDAAPEDVARGELKEETGLNAGKMEYVGYQKLAFVVAMQFWKVIAEVLKVMPSLAYSDTFVAFKILLSFGCHVAPCQHVMPEYECSRSLVCSGVFNG